MCSHWDILVMNKINFGPFYNHKHESFIASLWSNIHGDHALTECDGPLATDAKYSKPGDINIPFNVLRCLVFLKEFLGLRYLQKAQASVGISWGFLVCIS